MGGHHHGYAKGALLFDARINLYEICVLHILPSGGLHMSGFIHKHKLDQ